MGDLTRGYTFTDGKEDDCSADTLHRLVEDAVLNNSAIAGKELLGAGSIADSDEILLRDDSATGLRRIKLSGLKSYVQTGISVQKLRLEVTQTAHGFAIGDIVRRVTGGGSYEKAAASYPAETFDFTSIDTSTDVITITGHSLVHGERIIFGTAGTMPTDVGEGTQYFVEKIDANSIKLHHVSTLDDAVDFSDQGSGVHFVSYKLDEAHLIGMVDTTVDANTFTLVFQGYVASVGSFNDGKPRYLSSTEGELTETPPTAVGTYVLPVLIPIANNASIVCQAIRRRSGVKSIPRESYQDLSLPYEALTVPVRRKVDRMPHGAKAQTVLSGRIGAATGLADFIEAGSGLQAILKAATTPCVISFANGFDIEAFNYIERITADTNFDSLTADSQCYLYIDRASTGALTAAHTIQCPEYGYVKSLFRDWSFMPRMTGASTPSGWVASASGGTAWTGFDGRNNSHSSATRWQAGGTSGWLRIQLPRSVVVNAYEIDVANWNATGPRDWQFQGSNDGASWTTLDSQTGVTWSAEERKKYTFSNSAAYLYYRINVTGDNGGDISIANLSLFEAINHYFVIPEMTMYAYEGAAWVKKNRVFVGDCITNGASVTDQDAYAINGQWRMSGPVITPSISTREHNLGYPPHQITVKPFARILPNWPWIQLNPTGVMLFGAVSQVGVEVKLGYGSTVNSGLNGYLKTVAYEVCDEGIMRGEQWPSGDVGWADANIERGDFMLELERSW